MFSSLKILEMREGYLKSCFLIYTVKCSLRLALNQVIGIVNAVVLYRKEDHIAPGNDGAAM